MQKLCVGLAVAVGMLYAGAAWAESPVRAKVRLASPITHSDWMLRSPAPAWGPEGVRQILDRCKECGWSRVYWRCFDGGRACHLSKLKEGLIDEIVAAGYYRPGGSAEAAYRVMQRETDGKVAVWLYGWIGSADQFRADVQLAERLGAPQLLLWESDYIGLPPANVATVQAMHDYAHK